MAKKSKPISMMGIESPTGSHLPVIESCLSRIHDGALVIEHGAGLYSTPLFARVGVRVVCAESHPGWAEWAQWIYRGRVEMIGSFKSVVPLLSDAALVFIDGPASERGPLVQACLNARVPAIVAHDTNDRDWKEYGYQPHMFKAAGYAVTHSSEDTHRTTRWLLSP